MALSLVWFAGVTPDRREIQLLSENGFVHGLKTETCQFSTSFSCESHGEGKGTMPLPEYRSSMVSIVSKYGLDWSVWIGSENGFFILLDESASEAQNSTWTAP